MFSLIKLWILGVQFKTVRTVLDEKFIFLGALRGGRCLVVWHPEGGTGADAPRLGGSGQAEFHQEPTAGPLPAHRQQAGDEIVRLQEGAHEGEDQTESLRSLGHPSLFQLSVSLTYFIVK